ncbi:hypothetical protein J6590_063736 [Homalodisca vitripennis]|nr:hypothetical protein J6590_063736 [Homalodisca vitripennis]
MTAEPSDLPQPSASSIPSTEPTPATDVHQPMMTPAVHLPSESTVVTSVEGGKSQYGDMSASVTGETNSEASLSSGICNDSVSKNFLDDMSDGECHAYGPDHEARLYEMSYAQLTVFLTCGETHGDMALKLKEK